ncbi:hypothetical protein KIN34_12975 [Cellulomonas sp. DKR-3]|uniref:Pilus assembly protein PilO n=1 Tax=Cellulomonas fulva TaxID=2835530 RepID=A0ABS5U1F3_9CELL|nr:hypothetical protein [Cellulomonas fulva]MBT0995196.1 hypothetical protein [Cellulomonas fulva]
MGASKKRTWIGGTAFVAVLLAVAAWFLLVSPNLSKASETRAETEAAESFNQVLGLKLTKLKSDFGKLEDYKAELAEREKQIPSTADLESYLDGLDAIAVRRDVTITAVTAGTPEEFLLAEVAEPEPEPSAEDESESESEDESGSAAEEDEDEGPKVPLGLTAIPVSVTVIGTYEDTMAFLDDVHKRNPRVFLVSGLTGTSQKASDGSSGKPATEEGDQELAITGYIYTLPNDVDRGDDEPTDEPGRLPSNDGKNPLLPVTGA